MKSHPSPFEMICLFVVYVNIDLSSSSLSGTIIIINVISPYWFQKKMGTRGVLLLTTCVALSLYTIADAGSREMHRSEHPSPPPPANSLVFSAGFSSDMVLQQATATKLYGFTASPTASILVVVTPPAGSPSYTVAAVVEPVSASSLLHHPPPLPRFIRSLGPLYLFRSIDPLDCHPFGSMHMVQRANII